MTNWLRYAALSLVMSGGVIFACHAAETLPRTLGPGFVLGAGEATFAKAHQVTPSRCASCYEGEHMAEVVVTVVASALPTLDALGVTTDAPQLSVTSFFLDGKLRSMRIGGLKSREGFKVARQKFGPGKVVDRRSGLLAIEWTNRSTILRLTDWQGEFEVILAIRSDTRNGAGK